jgi:hypothetical protein
MLSPKTIACMGQRAIALLTALYLSALCLGQPVFASELKWASFSEAPSALRQAVAAETKTPEGELGRMSFLTLSKAGRSSVYVINSRLSYDKKEGKTCGAAGCLFLSYVQVTGKYQKVLSSYFIDRLPKGYEFLRIGEEKMGYPCLQFTSLKTWGGTKPPIAKTFCFDGEKYRGQ